MFIRSPSHKPATEFGKSRNINKFQKIVCRFGGQLISTPPHPNCRAALLTSLGPTIGQILFEEL
jgi:hypothetical protein